MSTEDREWSDFRRSMLKLCIVIAAVFGWGVGTMQAAFGVDPVWAGPLFMVGLAWVVRPDRR